MVINVHCFGKQNNNKSFHLLLNGITLMLLTQYKCTTDIWSTRSKWIEYLSTPIDQFVASWELVGGPAGGCTFSIVWISDPEQENIYTSGADSQSCTLQGQLQMSSDDQVERRVLLDKYPA